MEASALSMTRMSALELRMLHWHVLRPVACRFRRARRAQVKKGESFTYVRMYAKSPYLLIIMARTLLYSTYIDGFSNVGACLFMTRGLVRRVVMSTSS